VESYELLLQTSAKSSELLLLLTRRVRFLRADPPPRPPPRPPLVKSLFTLRRQASIGRELQTKIEERACNRATLFKPQVELSYNPPPPSLLLPLPMSLLYTPSVNNS